MRNLVVYNHGKDSIPWGEKALALAEVAKNRGFMFISPDYQASNNPEWRVRQLTNMGFASYQSIVLVGSSMGAYVATVAAESIRPDGLFLIAPAFYLPNYACCEFSPNTTRIEVFHGWRDEVIPPENAWRFCQNHHAALHMVDGDHRLLSALPIMVERFDRFLLNCLGESN